MDNQNEIANHVMKQIVNHVMKKQNFEKYQDILVVVLMDTLKKTKFVYHVMNQHLIEKYKTTSVKMAIMKKVLFMIKNVIPNVKLVMDNTKQIAYHVMKQIVKHVMKRLDFVKSRNCLYLY